MFPARREQRKARHVRPPLAHCAPPFTERAQRTPISHQMPSQSSRRVRQREQTGHCTSAASHAGADIDKVRELPPCHVARRGPKKRQHLPLFPHRLSLRNDSPSRRRRGKHSRKRAVRRHACATGTIAASQEERERTSASDPRLQQRTQKGWRWCSPFVFRLRRRVRRPYVVLSRYARFNATPSFAMSA